MRTLHNCLHCVGSRYEEVIGEAITSGTKRSTGLFRMPKTRELAAFIDFRGRFSDVRAREFMSCCLFSVVCLHIKHIRINSKYHCRSFFRRLKCNNAYIARGCLITCVSRVQMHDAVDLIGKYDY